MKLTFLAAFVALTVFIVQSQSAFIEIPVAILIAKAFWKAMPSSIHECAAGYKEAIIDGITVTARKYYEKASKREDFYKPDKKWNFQQSFGKSIVFQKWKNSSDICYDKVEKEFGGFFSTFPDNLLQACGTVLNGITAVCTRAGREFFKWFMKNISDSVGHLG